jgi:hypothetical protein
LIKETLDEYKDICRFLFAFIDWDETAPKEIIDQISTIPNDWLENGKIDNADYFIYNLFFI